MLQFVDFNERIFQASLDWLEDDEILRLIDGHRASRSARCDWFSNLPAREDYLIWGLEFDGKPIGAFGLKNVKATDGEYWGYIGDKFHWGSGIGRQMLREAEVRAKSVALSRLYLRVKVENIRAINLYFSSGYKIIDLVDGLMYRMDKSIR